MTAMSITRQRAIVDATQLLLNRGAPLRDVRFGEDGNGGTYAQWRTMRLDIIKDKGAELETWNITEKIVRAEPDFLYSDFLPDEAYGRLEKLVKSVARPGMLAAEVGCFTGRTAFATLPTIKENGGLFYLIDWFRGCVDSKCVWTPEQFPRNHVMSTLLDNLEAGDFSDCAVAMVGNSVDTAMILAGHCLDYLYIGADHRYTQFSADLDAWWPKLKHGGVMCGHGLDRRIERDGPEWARCLELCEQDCVDGVHWGIARALAERFPEYGNETGIWWVYKGIL